MPSVTPSHSQDCIGLVWHVNRVVFFLISGTCARSCNRYLFVQVTEEIAFLVNSFSFKFVK